MNDRTPSSDRPELPPPASGVKNIEVKAALLLLFMAVLVVASAAYVLYARGVFERTQRVVLLADDSEGVVVGMDMTFAGFPIGRVARIELGDDGTARILVDVPSKDARWLRTSSIFTMERSLVGGTRIRAFSGVLDDPELEDGAERTVLRGDASAEIPRLAAQARELLDNLNELTRGGSPLAKTLGNVEGATAKLNGPQGAMGLLLGNEDDARKIVTAVEKANALLARADALAQRLDKLVVSADKLVVNADKQVFGEAPGAGGVAGQAGLVGDVRVTVSQLNGLLGEARNSLQKVDGVLVEAQGIASNTREATVDLTALRAEVEASLRKVDSLVNEINRKWPFAREAEIKLP